MADEDRREEVTIWLTAIGLGALVDRFLQNGYINLIHCSNLSDDDLNVLGIITQGTRRTLLSQAKILKDQPTYFETLSAELEARKQQKKDDIDKLAPKAQQRFITMARADWAAYNYLCIQYEAKKWIEAALGETLADDFPTAIQDGTVLCRLANKIWPNSIQRVSPPGSFKYKLMDNIALFTNLLKSKGVDGRELFQPVELFEKRNMLKVVKALSKLSSLATKQGFSVQWQNFQNLEFSPKEIQDAKSLEGIADEPDLENHYKAREAYKSTFKSISITKEEVDKRAESERKKKQVNEKTEEELRRKQAELQRKIEEERLHESFKRVSVAPGRITSQLLKDPRIQSVQYEPKKQSISPALSQKYGGAEEVQRILDLIAYYEQDLDMESGDTAIHVAAREGERCVVHYLIEECEFSVDQPNGNYDTPLFEAARQGNVEMIEYLISMGADVKGWNRDGNTALHIAAEGHIDAVRELLEKGAEINCRNYDSETALFFAVRGTHVDVVDLLLFWCADVNVFNKDEITCLHIAASQGNVELINKLCGTSADLNARNKDNATPLQIAAENQHINVIEKLVDLGADLNAQSNDGRNALYLAAYNGDLNTARLLLSKGADVNSKDEEGWTPLHAACSRGHGLLAAEFVVKQNVTINVLNLEGTTPLFQAVAAGKRSIASFLIDNGADVNLSGPDAWKPIHAAVFNEYEKTTLLLIENHADLSVQCKDLKNYSPLHILLASPKPPVPMVMMLILHKAPLDIQHKTGATPLHLAAYWGNLDALKLLVEANANIGLKNDKGQTPLDVAAFYGQEKVAKFLAKKAGVKTPKITKNERQTSAVFNTPEAPPNPENGRRNSSILKR